MTFNGPRRHDTTMKTNFLSIFRFLFGLGCSLRISSSQANENALNSK